MILFAVFVAGGTVGAVGMALMCAASKPAPRPAPKTVTLESMSDVHDAGFDDWLDDA